MQSLGKIVGWLNLRRSREVKESQALDELGSGFWLCLFPLLQQARGPGRNPLSHSQRFPAELVVTDCPSSPGTQKVRAACPVGI